MKLAEIKSMFRVGDVWTGLRIDGAHVSRTERTVSQVRSAEVVWTIVGDDAPKKYSPLPKQRDVITARDGLLRFKIGRAAGDIDVILVKRGEYSSAAEWCAKHALAGTPGDPLPANLSAACLTQINGERDTFADVVKAFAATLQMAAP